MFDETLQKPEPQRRARPLLLTARWTTICSKESARSPSSSAEHLVEHVLSAIYFQLKHVKLVEVTLEWLQAQVPEFMVGQGAEDPVAEFKRRGNCDSKVAHLLTDLLYDLLSGVYDARITKARAAAQGASGASAAPHGALDNAGPQGEFC